MSSWSLLYCVEMSMSSLKSVTAKRREKCCTGCDGMSEISVQHFYSMNDTIKRELSQLFRLFWHNIGLVWSLAVNKGSYSERGNAALKTSLIWFCLPSNDWPFWVIQAQPFYGYGQKPHWVKMSHFRTLKSSNHKVDQRRWWTALVLLVFVIYFDVFYVVLKAALNTTV